MIKIKPIIRKEQKADQLIDVVDIEGEQVAVVVRSFRDLDEAKKYDNVVIEEEFDAQIVADFLQAKAVAQAATDAQAQIDAAQDAVDKELAKACDGFAYLFLKYVPTLTAGEKAAIQVFRDKYAAWIEKLG